MAGAPIFKVYDANGKYQAAVKETAAGGALMGLYGPGATIRYGHSARRAVWTEGAETQPAGESYDVVAGTVAARLADMGVTWEMLI